MDQVEQKLPHSQLPGASAKPLLAAPGTSVSKEQLERRYRQPQWQQRRRRRRGSGSGSSAAAVQQHSSTAVAQQQHSSSTAAAQQQHSSTAAAGGLVGAGGRLWLMDEWLGGWVAGGWLAGWLGGLVGAGWLGGVAGRVASQPGLPRDMLRADDMLCFTAVYCGLPLMHVSPDFVAD